MSRCDYCHEEFYSGGVSAVGVGTFCGHKCKVLAIHDKAGLGTELHYFRCPLCQAVLVTSIKSSRPERCRCSGTWLTYSHSVTVESKEEQTLFARGRVWNPHTTVEPWTCVRCGESKTETPHVRADGPCCEACYHAEAEPPRLLTPDEIAIKQTARAAFRRAEEDRHEAAYQAKESR